MSSAGLSLPGVAPARALLAGALAALVLFAATLWLGTLWPWLGLGLRAAPAGLEVTSVDERGPCAGRLQPGAVLVAVVGEGGERIAVDAVTIARATYLLPSYQALDAFVASHRRLHDMVLGGPVTLALADGSAVEVRVQARRPLAALPRDFWAAAALGAFVLLMAAGVFAYGPNRTAAALFLVAGIGMAGTQSTIALVLGRELVFDTRWSEALWGINLVSRLASHWGLLMIFWMYPRRFRPWRATAPVSALFVLSWLATVLRWWPRPNVAAPLVASLSVLVGVPLLAAWQWHATRSSPLERAVVKLMIVSFAGPAIVLVGFNQLPNLLWRQPLIESATALSAIGVLAYLGCAIGIARYRLFELDRWWFEALVWGTSGLLVVLLDALLLWLNTTVGLALGAALAIAGWLYFPLRQWLWRRLVPGVRPTFERHLPALVDRLFRAASQADLAASWRHLLAEIYAPLRVHDEALVLAAPRIGGQGLTLHVPALAAGQSIALDHADKGGRLFNAADAELAAELLALTRRAAEARRALDAEAAEREARQHEKEAMLQDLHDGLGGIATNIRLLAAIGQAEAPPPLARTLGQIADLADEALSEIRSFMYSLDEPDAGWPALAADLRAFGRKIVEPHGLDFELEAELAEGCPPPDSLLRLNLSRFCKEALTNAVKHAHASRVRVRLAVQADRLELRVGDDGVGIAAAPAAGHGRGLGNLRRRARQLGGELAFESGAGTTLRLCLPLPLKSPAPGIAVGSAAN